MTPQRALLEGWAGHFCSICKPPGAPLCSVGGIFWAGKSQPSTSWSTGPFRSRCTAAVTKPAVPGPGAPEDTSVPEKPLWPSSTYPSLCPGWGLGGLDLVFPFLLGGCPGFPPCPLPCVCPSGTDTPRGCPLTVISWLPIPFERKPGPPRFSSLRVSQMVHPPAFWGVCCHSPAGPAADMLLTDAYLCPLLHKPLHATWGAGLEDPGPIAPLL